MKRAVILHGTDGHPNINWLPWARNELENRGYKVWVPTLPGNHTPNHLVYDNFLRQSNWDFTNNLIIGHSSGATTLLNLLSEEWFPKIDKAILVGTFLNEKLTKTVDWHDPGQFANLFPEAEFDIDMLRKKSANYYFIHGDDDPYCDIEDARRLCSRLGGTFLTIRKGLHLSSNRKELPELIGYL